MINITMLRVVLSVIVLIAIDVVLLGAWIGAGTPSIESNDRKQVHLSLVAI